ncbi:MAG: phosphate acyltransferase [Verrucomicrobiia bacterium Tous-C3TDCM]|nr:MAG: phosphate acyltransferase [Verrucomicrobiae bacterium Tous-C3TDCM]
MKLALDVMGGDRAPTVNILGAKAALELYPQIDMIYLVGDEKTIAAECATHQLTSKKIRIVHAAEVIGMAEPGAKTVRRKKQSSINVAMDLVKAGEADAFVSAGNTGACVASATIKLRLIDGVERAGIASPLPNEHGVCNILDAGANPEAKPQHLVTYAIMGTAFAKHVLGITDPIVGLMSNGEEDEKGTTFTKETFALLKETPGIHFRGNVEGHDLFETPLHVVLCDGFTGNIVLKSCEATAKAMGKWLKAELTATPLRTLGAAMAKGAFKALKEKSSYESYGGCPLLGVNGVVIIAHGGSSALAIQNALRVGMETVQNKVNDAIRQALEKTQ